MPDRIPLAPGIEAPHFVDQMLSVFGKNPHEEPVFRLIRSERKRIWFAGESDCPEYAYLPYAGWVLETWIAPEKDAGPRASWGPMQEALLGPYPTFGTYNFVKHYPQDWEPSEETVRLVCIGIVESRNHSMRMREMAIRENLQKEERAQVIENAQAMEETFGSAEHGRIQAAVSGPKNNFRTGDDWERDRDRAVVRGTPMHLPRRGGAIYQPEN